MVKKSVAKLLVVKKFGGKPVDVEITNASSCVMGIFPNKTKCRKKGGTEGSVKVRSAPHISDVSATLFVSRKN